VKDHQKSPQVLLSSLSLSQVTHSTRTHTHQIYDDYYCVISDISYWNSSPQLIFSPGIIAAPRGLCFLFHLIIAPGINMKQNSTCAERRARASAGRSDQRKCASVRLFTGNRVQNANPRLCPRPPNQYSLIVLYLTREIACAHNYLFMSARTARLLLCAF
jgi:hypothetical protein